MNSLDTIKSILAKIIDFDININEDMSLVDDLALTSLQMMMFITKLEDMFGKEIPFSEVVGWHTIKDVMGSIQTDAQ